MVVDVDDTVVGFQNDMKNVKRRNKHIKIRRREL